VSGETLYVRHLGRQPYEPVFAAMRAFADRRDNSTADELWWVEHEPVFTQGQAGKEEHLLMPGDIPVVKVDRGGQVTYHGPGQIVGYPMVNIRRLGIGVRQLVSALENAMISTLAEHGIDSYARPDAPGVYVAGPAGHTKIGSLGIRIRRGAAYHGLSLNVDMDLSPFQRINPCGYQGLEMTQVKDLVAGPVPSMAVLQQGMLMLLKDALGYASVEVLPEPVSVLQENRYGE
jgi:lipoyl(octanoyl) transferase